MMSYVNMTAMSRTNTKGVLSKELTRRMKKEKGNTRGGSTIAATSKMEHLVIIVNGWKPLTIITNSFILDIATVLYRL